MFSVLKFQFYRSVPTVSRSKSNHPRKSVLTSPSTVTNNSRLQLFLNRKFTSPTHKKHTHPQPNSNPPTSPPSLLSQLSQQKTTKTQPTLTSKNNVLLPPPPTLIHHPRNLQRLRRQSLPRSKFLHALPTPIHQVPNGEHQEIFTLDGGRPEDGCEGCEPGGDVESGE